MAPTTRQQKLDASASNQPLLSGEETTPQDDSGDDYIDDSRRGVSRLPPPGSDGSLQDLTKLVAQLGASINALVKSQTDQAERTRRIEEQLLSSAVQEKNGLHEASQRHDLDSSALSSSADIQNDHGGNGLAWELQQLRRSIKDQWEVKPTTLTFTNFSTWKTNMLTDALLVEAHGISAQTILLETQYQAPQECTALQRSIWNSINDALYARLWKSLHPDIRPILTPPTAKSAAMLWDSITARFGTTKAQERYNLLRDMCALKLDGLDYMGHQSKWLKLMADLDRLDVTIDDVKHDLFIQSLGSWQSGFVKTKLDEFFATGGGGSQIKNLDLDDLMRQLQYRAQTQPPKRTKDQQASSGSKKSSSSTSTPTGADTRKSDSEATAASCCSYCNKPGHKEPNCWSKHIEKAPKAWVSSNASWIRDIRQKNGDSLDISGLETTSPAQAKKAAVPTQPLDSLFTRQSNWYFDTCASFHMTPHRELFTTYLSLDDGEKIGSVYGHSHASIGVGNVDMRLDGASVILHNVRHIPGLDSNLLSEAKLQDDGFLIRKSSTAPFHYELESPNGCKFFAVRDPSNVYRITTIEPTTAVGTSQSDTSSVSVEKAFANKASTSKSIQASALTTVSTTDTHETRAKASTDILSDFPKTLWEWHVALGHLNYDDVLYLARRPSSGVKIEGSKARPTCHVCLEAKITRRYSRNKASRATRPLMRIHVDIVGGGDAFGTDDDRSRAVPLAPNGYNYFLLITDDATRYRWVYGLTSRETTVIADRLRHWRCFINNLGFSNPAFLRADNEFGSGELRLLLDDWGSQLELTNPYSAWQNGAAERSNRIVLEKARAMLIASGLPMIFWFDAVEAAVFLTNVSPTSTPLYHDDAPAGTTSNVEIQPLDCRIPIEALTKSPAKVDYILPFGSTVYYHLHGTQAPTKKLNSKGMVGRVIGCYGATMYKVWNPRTGRVFTTADIRPAGTVLRIPFEGGDEVVDDDNEVSTPNEEVAADAESGLSTTAKQALHFMGLSEQEEDITDDDWVRPAKAFKAFAARTKSANLAADIPRSYKEAMASDQRDLWLEACRKEYQGLIDRGTWDLVRTEDIPHGLRPIPGKWVFDKKLQTDGSIRYKARWVIRGNISNGHAHLFGDKSAPVVMASTKLTLFAAAAHYGWFIAQADAVTAFLNGKLSNPVYMRQPTGFEQGEKGTLACKLRQAIYGLEASARIWYDTLCERLSSIGFRVSPYDPGLFIHVTKSNLYVTVHVDDFGIIGARTDDIRWVLDEMGKQFAIKDLGQMKHYLGLRVIRTDTGLKLSQADFIDNLLSDMGMSNCNPVSTPIDPGLIMDDLPDPQIDLKRYQHVVGCLQWLAGHTRPDIARAATLLAQYNTRPTPKCVALWKRVLAYLKGTRDVGINFHIGVGPLPRPIAYTDADWGGALIPGRRSCSGHVVLLAGGPVSWRSHLQTSVALSSNEAEYMAASDAARELEWLTRLVVDMGLYPRDADPVIFYMDNRGAKTLAESTLVSKRSKHIDIRYHYIRDVAARGIIKPTAIGTKDMAADGFTKPLAELMFKRFTGQLGLS